MMFVLPLVLFLSLSLCRQSSRFREFSYLERELFSLSLSVLRHSDSISEFVDIVKSSESGQLPNAACRSLLPQISVSVVLPDDKFENRVDELVDLVTFQELNFERSSLAAIVAYHPIFIENDPMVQILPFSYSNYSNIQSFFEYCIHTFSDCISLIFFSYFRVDMPMSCMSGLVGI